LSDKPQLLWLFFGLSGRLAPSAYFLAGLLLVIAQGLPLYHFTLAEPGSSADRGWAQILVFVVLLTWWPSFALAAKRFHDFGKPTYYALLSLIFTPLVLLVLACFRSDPGPNQYGRRSNAPADG
jgi:uncharacterized membrane protein YhaH (DUF805 family)